jgi:hypothetical protein
MYYLQLVDLITIWTHTQLIELALALDDLFMNMLAFMSVIKMNCT